MTDQPLMPRDFTVPDIIAGAGEPFALAFGAGGITMIGAVNTRVSELVNQMKDDKDFDLGHFLLKLLGIIEELGAQVRAV